MTLSSESILRVMSNDRVALAGGMSSVFDCWRSSSD